MNLKLRRENVPIPPNTKVLLKVSFFANHCEKAHYKPLCHTELKQDQIYSEKSMDMKPISQYKDEKKECS